MKTKEPTLTMPVIRALYPVPCQVSLAQADRPAFQCDIADLPEIRDRYCVGGAVVAYADGREGVRGMDLRQRFPTTHDIGEALGRLNPMLPKGGLSGRASTIMENNDRGLFERAWAAVDRALRYGRDNETNNA